MTSVVVVFDVVFFEEVDVEDVVNIPEGRGKFEAIRMGADAFGDGKWPEVELVELLHRSLCFDVFCVEPDQVAFGPGRSSVSAFVGELRVVFVCYRNLIAEVSLEFFELPGGEVRGVVWEVIEGDGEARMIAFVGEEGGDSCRRVRGVVVDELGER